MIALSDYHFKIKKYPTRRCSAYTNIVINRLCIIGGGTDTNLGSALAEGIVEAYDLHHIACIDIVAGKATFSPLFKEISPTLGTLKSLLPYES